MDQQIFQQYRLRRFEEALRLLRASSPAPDSHAVWLFLMITGRLEEAEGLAADELSRNPEFLNRPRNLFRSLIADVDATVNELMQELFPPDE